MNIQLYSGNNIYTLTIAKWINDQAETIRTDVFGNGPEETDEDEISFTPDTPNTPARTAKVMKTMMELNVNNQMEKEVETEVETEVIIRIIMIHLIQQTHQLK